MAKFTVNAHGSDPYKNFKFHVIWEGSHAAVAGVSKVSSLKRSTAVVGHREGRAPSSGRKSPARTKYEAVTLERGVTHDADFQAWANQVWKRGRGIARRGPPKKMWRTLVIEVRNEAGRVAKRYTLSGCWVSEFEGLPDLDGHANGVLIERLRIENEGWKREEVQPRPTKRKAKFTSR
jgi:phage tail-like protein